MTDRSKTFRQYIGNTGEDAAAEVLQQRGFKILERNYTVHNVGEIDIICEYKEKILVIEVKSRDSRERYGTPEEAVTGSKQLKVMKTTVCFCKENGYSLEKVSYFVAGVIHDVSGNIVDVKFTPFF